VGACFFRCSNTRKKIKGGEIAQGGSPVRRATRGWVVTRSSPWPQLTLMDILCLEITCQWFNLSLGLFVLVLWLFVFEGRGGSRVCVRCWEPGRWSGQRWLWGDVLWRGAGRCSLSALLSPGPNGAILVNAEIILLQEMRGKKTQQNRRKMDIVLFPPPVKCGCA